VQEEENTAFLVASFSLGLLGLIVTLMVSRTSQPISWHADCGHVK
jgi:hypothetical protein